LAQALAASPFKRPLAMAITTKSDCGLKESSFFNHHRFDNHSAWLDRELRNKRTLRGEPLGHGFAVPRAPAPARTERPFVVQECGMTSGKLLTRRYCQTDTDFRLETERADPYHFPNHLQVEDAMHYEDRRGRSQHIDPRCRAKLALPRDKILADAVPEEMVQNHIGDAKPRTRPDPVVMAIQFDPDVRPQKESLRELNCDFSCIDHPASERPIDMGASAGHGAGGKDWSWCMGGKKGFATPDHGDVHMQKTMSLPGTLSGKSLLAHQKGSFPGPFHGTAYIPSEPGSNLRQRGGQNAKSGFCGTFPSNETRPP